MEIRSHVTEPQKENDEFSFNAPSYYDLQNPVTEANYITNTEEYFFRKSLCTPTKELRASSEFPRSIDNHSSTKLHKENNQMAHENRISEHEAMRTPDNNASMDETLREIQHPSTPKPSILNPSLPNYDQLYAIRQQEMFSLRRQSEPSASLDVDVRMSDASTVETLDLNHQKAQIASGPKYQTFSIDAGSRIASSMQKDHQMRSSSTRSFSMEAESTPFAYRESTSLTFSQPTKSYLSKIEAEQAFRGVHREHSGSVSSNGRPPLTQPISPKLHTNRQWSNAGQRRKSDDSRMSSTSRELQKIQEERLQLQMERMRIREFHERTKSKRPLADIYQRSTKQLTIPVSPQFQADHRGRCDAHHTRSGNTAALESNQDEDDGFDYGECNSQGREQPHPPIPPEKLLSRDFEFALPQQYTSITASQRTIPHSPHLATAERAGRYCFQSMIRDEKESETVSDALKPKKAGGLTKPQTPQLETRRRAQLMSQFRKPIEMIDSDEEELAKKFHAKPLNKKIFDAKPPLAGFPSRKEIEKPISTTFTSHSADVKRVNRAPEASKRLESNERRSIQPRRPKPHELVVPETPDLKSIERHRQYQVQFRQRLEIEDEHAKRQREFRAKPIRMASTPVPFQGSEKPLTEVKPFALQGDKWHERARERLEMKKREEEAKYKDGARFKAKPLPQVVYASSDQLSSKHFQIKPSCKPVTKFSAPMLASERRASERAAFDAAERERRGQEEALKRQIDEESRQMEDEALRRLRREQLRFHARPIQGKIPFKLKPSDKPLTEPESPFVHASRPKYRVPPAPQKLHS
uniref:Uncharacterized protein AlNc14C268G9932 n=1 Tax=Albugo laibachii Nc14 TaxID=890382 RepID=F0WUB1_9STRA|nr:conserved hypothetical protein [Albugo laibachii Nc14]CCA26513.1 conserved hypothetical protein [Albugo laibachii Nc14]|eukprot:CCA26513.1 conserved hypothetical protein [Albugo laibachii Nc14]